MQVLDYKERAVGKDLVQVAVYVEHESQKGIMVGRGGSALKAMATAARADIEAFVGKFNVTKAIPELLNHTFACTIGQFVLQTIPQLSMV